MKSVSFATACLSALVLFTACDADSNGPAGPREVCQAYIECVNAVAPNELATAAATYGKSGACFTELSETSCREACYKGLASMRKISGNDPRCPACFVDADCSDLRFGVDLRSGVCDKDAGRCVACTSDAHCEEPAPVCKIVSQTDTHFPYQPSSNTCVECTQDAHCPGGYCDELNRCVECTTDAQCGVGLSRCLRNKCVACTADSDCGANKACTYDLKCVTPSCERLEATLDGTSKLCGTNYSKEGNVTLDCGTCSRGDCKLIGMHNNVCSLVGINCDPRSSGRCLEDEACTYSHKASIFVCTKKSEIFGYGCKRDIDCSDGHMTCTGSRVCMPSCLSDDHCAILGSQARCNYQSYCTAN
jgi:Cys-rich repeat protein